jgi:hypothetical protein
MSRFSELEYRNIYSSLGVKKESKKESKKERKKERSPWYRQLYELGCTVIVDVLQRGR